jgi:hypothetical protein
MHDGSVQAVGERRRAFLTHVIARELLQRAARALAVRDIPLMPLKGVWLQATVYDPPESRALTDADVLVPEERYAEAVEALLGLGFERQQQNVSEVALWHPELPLQLDVHRRLFLPGAFSLSTAGLFARATRDVTSFGAPVWMPDPMDGLAHLVGHFVKSRESPRESRYHEDFVRVLDGFELDATSCARHLHDAGMARAARYALQAPAGAGHSRVRGILAALPPDPLGDVLVALSAGVRGASGGGRLLSAAPGYLLERSLPSAVSVGARRALERSRARAEAARD